MNLSKLSDYAMRLLSVLFLALAGVGATPSQSPQEQPVVTFAPEQPKWGDTVTVTYNTRAKGAKFSPHDDVFVVAMTRYEDHSEKKVSGRATVKGHLLEFSFPMKEGSAYAFAEFITLTQWDKDNDARFMVYNRDGKPARNGSMNMMYAGKSGRLQVSEVIKHIDREIQDYPENYAAYQYKWLFSRATPEAIKEDLKKMSEAGRGDTVEYLFAKVVAATSMKDEAQARAALTAMASRFPDSLLTLRAFTEYDKAAFTKQFPQTYLAEINRLKKDAAAQNPATALARAALSYLMTDEVKAYDLAEKVSRAWASQEENNPLPLYRLAAALEKQAKQDAATDALNKSINGFLNGNYRLYEDYVGSGEPTYLSAAFRLKAKLAFEKGLFGEALGALAVAKQYQRDSDPRTAEFEAQVWSKLERWDKVADAYAEALRNGSKTAEGLMKELYTKRHGSAEGFEPYLAEKMKNAASGKEAGATSAPAFTATAIDGKTFDLTSLRGKTVVLNFWFVGCPGCDVEIPALNRLVAEFKDKDVVFLSFALDDKATLEKYLKQNPFHYATVATASTFSDKYGVTGYPTHIIIDKEGRIRGRKVGGSEKTDDELRPLIKAAL